MKNNQRYGKQTSSSTSKSGPHPDDTQEMYDNIKQIKQILPDWKEDMDIRMALEENNNDADAVITKYLEGQNKWETIPAKKQKKESQTQPEKKPFTKKPYEKRNFEQNADNKQQPQASGAPQGMNNKPMNKQPRPPKQFQQKKKFVKEEEKKPEEVKKVEKSSIELEDKPIETMSFADLVETPKPKPKKTQPKKKVAKKEEIVEEVVNEENAEEEEQVEPEEKEEAKDEEAYEEVEESKEEPKEEPAATSDSNDFWGEPSPKPEDEKVKEEVENEWTGKSDAKPAEQPKAEAKPAEQPKVEEQEEEEQEEEEEEEPEEPKQQSQPAALETATQYTPPQDKKIAQKGNEADLVLPQNFSGHGNNSLNLTFGSFGSEEQQKASQQAEVEQQEEMEAQNMNQQMPYGAFRMGPQPSFFPDQYAKQQAVPKPQFQTKPAGIPNMYPTYPYPQPYPYPNPYFMQLYTMPFSPAQNVNPADQQKTAFGMQFDQKRMAYQPQMPVGMVPFQQMPTQQMVPQQQQMGVGAQEKKNDPSQVRPQQQPQQQQNPQMHQQQKMLQPNEFQPYAAMQPAPEMMYTQYLPPQQFYPYPAQPNVRGRGGKNPKRGTGRGNVNPGMYGQPMQPMYGQPMGPYNMGPSQEQKPQEQWQM